MFLISTIVTATLLPMAYYLYVGFHKNSRALDLDDYFVYQRRVTASDFANTSIGYSLQVAALFLFADWGIRYGLGAFWVPLFWGIGFFLLYLSVRFFDLFVTEAGRWTIHGYLQHVSGSRFVQVVAAIATIIGLWGVMMVEIDYATTIYTPFFSGETGLYVVGLVLLLFALLYISYGGYKAEVNTERIQVPVAYTTLLLVIVLLISALHTTATIQVFWGLVLLLFVLCILMIIAKVGVVPQRPLADHQIFIPIVVLAALGLLAITSWLVPPKAVTLAPMPGLFEDLSGQLQAQGPLLLFSLLLANGLWQFVDISNWQRVASVELASGPAHLRFVPLRRGLWRIMIESPVSWGFGVIFGLALRYTGYLQPGEDPAAAVTNFVSALATGYSAVPILGSYGWLLYPVFVAAVIAIMLSTVSALLAAITFTAFHDLPPWAKSKSLKSARLYTLAIAVLGAMIYYGFRYSYGVGIQTLLYTFYSSQLSLFPTVLAALVRKRVSAAASITSIFIGIVMTFFAATVVVQVNPDLFLIPPLFAVGSSILVYWLMATVQKPTNERR